MKCFACGYEHPRDISCIVARKLRSDRDLLIAVLTVVVAAGFYFGIQLLRSLPQITW